MRPISVNSPRRLGGRLVPPCCFLGFFRRVSNHRFAIECTSHVRLCLQFQVTKIFQKQALIGFASIAIWNRNKVVVTLAITVWGISVVSHIQSKHLPLTLPGEDL